MGSGTTENHLFFLLQKNMEQLTRASVGRENCQLALFFMPGFPERRQIREFHWSKAEGVATGNGYEAGYCRHTNGHVETYAERDRGGQA